MSTKQTISLLSLPTHQRQGSCDLRASAHICKQVYRYIISSKYSVCLPLHKAKLILSASCENISTDSLMWYMEKTSLGFLIIMPGIIYHVEESLQMFIQASFDMLIAQLHTQNLTLAYHLCEHMCGKPTRHLDSNLQR